MQWHLPDGTTAINPKEEGMGIMLSSFCSRDFGYGFDLSDAQLAIVNRFREGKECLDDEAALEVMQTKNKNKLTSSPFIQKFEYGVNSEGFWNYHHMVIQFEDVVDVLKALFHEQYHFIFFFDHSSGHDKTRPNGLTSSRMNKFFGGSQNIMRNSEIKNSSFLGEFHHDNCLKIGDVQSMQYAESDSGPFYLDDAKKQELKYDCELDQTEKKSYSSAID